METKYFTPKQASAYLKYLGLHMGMKAFRQCIKEGKIVIIQFPNKKQYISEQALQDFINKHTGVYKQ